MANINEVSILDLLPPSINNNEQIIASSKAIDLEIGKLQEMIKTLCILPNIDNLAEDMVDVLAKQFDAPYYSDTLSLNTKRSVVKNAINWHKAKGTVASIEEVVNTIFGGDSKVVEWHEYGGNPHHFKIHTTQIATSDATIEEFKRVAESIKRKSSVLEEVIVILTNNFYMNYGFSLQTGDVLTFRQEG